MEQHRDEHIVCASCGTSFLFSAAEAAVYTQRNLAVPPKRCRDCRRARKEQRGGPGAGTWGGHAHQGSHGAGGYRGHARADVRPPRYTGDVNEYRSPMQDTYAGMSAGAAGGNRRPRNGNVLRDDGNYRAPAFAASGNVAPAQVELRHGKGPHPASGGREGGEVAPRGPRAPRRRPMFSITCKSCGTEGQVPFKPIEGRDVFCQACYRARKPD